jgi:endonuclease I
MFKHSLSSLFLIYIFCSSLVAAQIPSYYSSIDFSQTGDNLKVQLSMLITDTHTTLIPYTSTSNTDTWDILSISDLENSSSDNVLLIYGFNDFDGLFKTDRTRGAFETCHVSYCEDKWNREHVFSRSLADPDLVTNYPSAGTDAHNLRAADPAKNNEKSNNLFIDSTGDESRVINVDYFYPGEEWKGDVARIIMYMYLRYPTQCEAINTATGTADYSPNGDMPDVFLKWNEEDPVSPLEQIRNDVISSYQGNRNPFIDNPYLATLIWNGPSAVDTWGVLSLQTEEEFSISVSPTLTNRFITISGVNSNDFEVFIYNQLGQRIIQSNHSKTIDVSHFAAGLYIVRVSLLGRTAQSKFIVR